MRRRRECLACGHRTTTYERVELGPLWVRKHDGRVEQFCREKLLRGIGVACSKRSVPLEHLERIVQSVELDLRARGGKEVASTDVGDRALAELVLVDEAAAIRFASVIHRTQSLDGFRTVLDRMDEALGPIDATTPARQRFERDVDRDPVPAGAGAGG